MPSRRQGPTIVEQLRSLLARGPLTGKEIRKRLGGCNPKTIGVTLSQRKDVFERVPEEEDSQRPYRLTKAFRPADQAGAGPDGQDDPQRQPG